jgi:hypothetical protein
MNTVMKRALARLPLDQTFAGSNAAEVEVFLRAIKVRSTTSFGGEVKQSVPGRKILRNSKNPYSMKEILVGKINGYFSRSFYCFATKYLCWILLNTYGGWIRNDQNSDEEAQQINNGRSVWDALCDTNPVNSNSAFCKGRGKFWLGEKLLVSQEDCSMMMDE